LNILLPTSYFAPVSYYAALLRAGEITVELYEHFPKQTWRNRCTIYSPNGMQHLVVPLDGRKDKTLTKDIRISYDRDWQTLHWRSLEAAYRSSPYFEFYEDDFAPFYEERYASLVEFNTRIQEKVMELLKIQKDIHCTGAYEARPAGLTDLRHLVSKEEVRGKQFPRYMQVFENKHGFLSNLSIADLLFNLGPRAPDYLRELHM
jgi:hypothetical protein